MCDRTREFMALVSTLPPPQQVPAKAQPQVTAAAAVATLQEFHGATADIARGIHATSQQLASLTKLVQQRGLFNDPAEDINTLVHHIKQGIQGLNAQLDATGSYVENRKRQLGQQPASHSAHVVGQLKTELMETTRVFKDVLQQRSSNLKAQEDRKDMFFHKPSAVALGKPAVYRPISSPPIPKPSGGASSGYGASSNGSAGVAAGNGVNGLRSRGGSASSSKGLELLPRPGQVTSLPDMEQDGGTMAGGMDDQSAPLIPALAQQQLIPSHSYLQSRSTAMQEVETHIVELGTIFNRLATMLQSQRELVESIHDNVEDAADNVERGQLALVSTLRSVTSNRALAAKVFGILFIFMILFVLLFL